MADTITVYGIPNCDTVKKARKWFDANSVSYEFHDYKKKGIDKATLNNWSQSVDWETLVNRRGTTWRKLDDDQKKDLSQTSATGLMIENTSLIKRPVVVHKGGILVGFDEAQYEKAFT